MTGFPLRIEFFYAITFAFLISASLGCRVAGTGSDSPQAAPPSPLRVGISGDYAPFSLWPEETPGAPPQGFSVAVAEAYARDRGREIQWVRFRWPELTRDLRDGRFDFALSGVTIRPERSLSGRFSVPLTISGAVVLLPETGDAAREIERGQDPVRVLDRPGIRLAVNAGGHLEAVTRRLFPVATILAVADNASVPEQLAAGRADAIVSDSLEAPHWRQQHPGLRGVGPLTHDWKAAWFAPVPATRTAIEADLFDDWLMAAEADGRLARLRARAGLPDERTAEPVAALLARIDERLSLMGEVAESKRAQRRPIEDAQREAQVLAAAQAAVARIAATRGTPAPDGAAVQRFFRAQIEAAKAIQRRQLALAGAREPGHSETDAQRAAARDRLEHVLRPALLSLGDRIARLIVTCRATPGASLHDGQLERALERHALPEERRRELAAALRELLLSPAATASVPRPPPARAAPDTAPSA